MYFIWRRDQRRLTTATTATNEPTANMTMSAMTTTMAMMMMTTTTTTTTTMTMKTTLVQKDKENEMKTRMQINKKKSDCKRRGDGNWGPETECERGGQSRWKRLLNVCLKWEKVRFVLSYRVDLFASFRGRPKTMMMNKKKTWTKRNAYAKLTHITNANTNKWHWMAAQKSVQKHWMPSHN